MQPHTQTHTGIWDPSAEAAVCWGCRHRHWHTVLAPQLLVWAGRSQVHPLQWAELGCKAWLPSLRFVSSTHHPLPCQAALEWSFQGIQTEFHLWQVPFYLVQLATVQKLGSKSLSVACPCSAAMQAEGKKSPVFFSRKAQAKWQQFQCASAKFWIANPRNTTRGDKSTVELFFWAEAGSIKEKFLSLKSLCSPLSLVSSGLSWKHQWLQWKHQVSWSTTVILIVQITWLA